MNYYKQIIFAVVVFLLLFLVVRLQLQVNNLKGKLDDTQKQLDDEKHTNEMLENELDEELTPEKIKEILEDHGYSEEQADYYIEMQ